MGKNLYTNFWKSNLPDIIKALQLALSLNDEVNTQITKTELDKYGDRVDYSFSFNYVNGITKPVRNSAVARDLQELLSSNQPFLNFARDKTIKFSLKKDGSNESYSFVISCRPVSET